MTGSSESTVASTGPGDRTVRVAYILHRFPFITETFIAREMYWIQKHNVDLTIFSLMHPKHPASSDEARALLGRAHYSPVISWRVLKAQARFLWRQPLAYCRALARVVHQTYREPKVLGLSLALFPKSVLFASMVKEMRIQHVHANFVWLEGLAAGVVRDLTGITFTIHPHAFGLFGRNQRNVRSEITNASHVVTISEYHRDYILDLCPSLSPRDITVVHCGVETSQISPAKRRLTSERPHVLSVGRDVEKKGHKYLISACALLRDRGIDVSCDIIVGTDQGAKGLQASIDGHRLQDRVQLSGAHNQEELLERYRAADIFALACVVAEDGDRDGIPVVLMEAMSCELPVVTTPVAGIPELVHDGVSGLLVPERNAAALAEAIERLVSDGELRARLGMQGRRAIQSGFEAADNAAAVAAIFHEIVPAIPNGRQPATPPPLDVGEFRREAEVKS